MLVAFANLATLATLAAAAAAAAAAARAIVYHRALPELPAPSPSSLAVTHRLPCFPSRRVSRVTVPLCRCGRIASLPPCCRLTVAAVLVMVIINSGHEEQVPVVSRNAFVFTSGVMHSTSLARYRAYTSTRFPRRFPVLVLVFEATAVKFSPRRLPRPQDLPISNTFASQHFISIDNDRRMNIEMQKNTPSLMARPLRTYVDNFRP